MGRRRLPPESIRCLARSGIRVTALPMRAWIMRSVAAMSALTSVCRRSTGEMPSVLALRVSGLSIVRSLPFGPGIARLEGEKGAVKPTNARTGHGKKAHARHIENQRSGPTQFRAKPAGRGGYRLCRVRRERQYHGWQSGH